MSGVGAPRTNPSCRDPSCFSLDRNAFPNTVNHVVKRCHIRISHGINPFTGDPGEGDTDRADLEGSYRVVDSLLWRYSDLLERCALTRRDCDFDLSIVGVWSDGVPVVRAEVSPHPVDSGPMPALLAECDALTASGAAPPLDLNPRRDRCGPAHL